MSEERGTPEATYSVYRGWRPQVIMMAAIFGCVAVGLIYATVTQTQGPPWGFTVCWTAAYVWVASQILFRYAFELVSSGYEISWRAPLRSGRFAASDLRSVRPYRWGRNAAVFELRNGKKLYVLVTKGFSGFMRELALVAPFANVEVGRFAELADRWPGKRRYRP